MTDDLGVRDFATRCSCCDWKCRDMLFAGVIGSKRGPVSTGLAGDNSKFEIQLNEEVYVRFLPANIGLFGDSITNLGGDPALGVVVRRLMTSLSLLLLVLM